MNARFSRLRGGLRVGADFFLRRAILAPSNVDCPRGLVDRIEDLDARTFDVSRIHPDIVVFFEDTGALDLLIRSHWVFPFSIAWRVVRVVLRWVGQFVLPIREGRIATRVFGIDREQDGRADARGVVRTYEETSEVMQVAAYATHQDAQGRRYMSATFPMPGGNITGILRLDRIEGTQGEDQEGRLAIALTSVSKRHPNEQAERDAAGVWFVIGRWSIRAPLHEQIEMWASAMPSRPASLDPKIFEGTTIVAKHEQRLFGVRFVTHHYWFRPRR